MSTLEKARERAAKLIAEAEAEERLTSLLPIPPKHVSSVATSAPYVSYEAKGIREALEIYRAYADNVETAECWKSGCLSIMPEAINKYATDERATMDGAAHVQLVLNSYGERGQYQDAELTFFVLFPVKHSGFTLGQRVHVHIKFQPDYKWLPDRQVSFDHTGHVAKFNLTPKFIGEDNRRKWWSEAPSYRLSYEWADRPNFESWASQQGTVTP